MPNNPKKISINDIEIGMTANTTKVIKFDDVANFAQLSGDNNPIHLDKEFASKSRYKRNIAHGVLCSSLFSGIFGSQLPGEGCVYTFQSLNFKRPIYIDDEVEAIITVTEVNLNKNRVRFATNCYVNKKVCIDGEAEIYIPPTTSEKL